MFNNYDSIIMAANIVARQVSPGSFKGVALESVNDAAKGFIYHGLLGLVAFVGKDEATKMVLDMIEKASMHVERNPIFSDLARTTYDLIRLTKDVSRLTDIESVFVDSVPPQGATEQEKYDFFRKLARAAMATASCVIIVVATNEKADAKARAEWDEAEFQEKKVAILLFGEEIALPANMVNSPRVVAIVRSTNIDEARGKLAEIVDSIK